MQPIEAKALGTGRAENDGERQMENNSIIINYKCGQLGIKSELQSYETNSMLKHKAR